MPNPTGWIDPLGLIKGGGNDNYLVCTSATYPRADGSEAEVDFKITGSDAIPTGVLWPPTPSWVEKNGGKCHGARGRTGPESIIKYPNINSANLEEPLIPDNKNMPPKKSPTNLGKTIRSGFKDWIKISDLIL